ncbi:MAG: hypothetical protein FWE09_09885, partial [Treponema sp.]|nr:hypothetical protein [Treponema sp.]
MNISVLGHAGSRAMLFTLDGMYREINMPLGAQLLCSILSKFQFVAAPDLKPEEALRDVWNDEPSENLRREYMVMRPLDSGGFDLGRSLGFREGRSAHSVFREPPARPQEPTELIIWDEGLGGLEIPDSGFRAALWASPCAIPDPAQFEKVADKCFLFLSADALRDAGAMISRRISWERACSELIWQLQENPAFAHLAKAARIMVAFAEDGAVYIKNSDKGQPEASLILAHGGGEGTLRERSGRRHDDAFPLMAGALGAFFTRLLDGGAPPDKLREILEIGEGFLLSQGYAPSGNEIDISINASGRGWPAFPIPIVARQSATACANALAVPCGWAAENGL